MGTVYCGPYTDEIGGYSHEGYAARILPDGSETGTWTHETREFSGYRAHCDCGWRGTATYSPTDAGEDLALEEWDHDHLRPMVVAEARRHTFTGEDLLELARELRRAGSELIPAAQRGLVGVPLPERAAGLFDAADRLDDFLTNRAK